MHEYSYIAPSVAIISSLGKRFPHSAGKLGSVDYSFFKPIQKINGETVQGKAIHTTQTQLAMKYRV